MRQRTVFSLFLLSFFITLFTLDVFASDALPKGWYAEGNGGYSRTMSVKYAPNTSAVRYNGFGWGVNAGYKFMPYLGAEIGYVALNDVRIKNPQDVWFAKDRHHFYDAALKGMLPVGDSGFDFFGKLGVSRIHSTVTIVNQEAARGISIRSGASKSTGLFYGLGGEYAFFPQVIGNLQWQRARGKRDIGTLDLFSIGIAYIFL